MDLITLEALAAQCHRCKVPFVQIKPVFARGDVGADLVICGMCPGHEENLAGSPFVGPAGKILDKIILSAFGSKDYGLLTGVYITNLVKCFVPAGNSLDEKWMSNCLSYFIVQLELLKPKVIIALGKDVCNFLLGTDEQIGAMRGNIYDYMNVKTICTYHPSYLTRGGGVNHKHFDRVVNDFKKALKYI